MKKIIILFTIGDAGSNKLEWHRNGHNYMRIVDIATLHNIMATARTIPFSIKQMGLEVDEVVLGIVEK